MDWKNLSFDAIGTHWNISFARTGDVERNQGVTEQIQHAIAEFDEAFSRFRPDSLVTEIAQRTGTFAMPAHGFELLRFYEQLYTLTHGSVTPFIGQMMADAGYDATYSFQPKPLHEPPKWGDAISYDEHEIEVRQPVLLDFGAAGKGCLVDIIARLLQVAGSTDFTINAGGDIMHRSLTGETVTVGLENPFDTSEVIGTVELDNQSLCASAGSKRKWGNFHHIMNPATLRSVEDIQATWVIADDTMTADGLATALFFVSPSQVLQQFAFSYALLDKAGGLRYAKNFPAKFFEEVHHE